jgi:hypothetical protein
MDCDTTARKLDLLEASCSLLSALHTQKQDMPAAVKVQLLQMLEQWRVRTGVVSGHVLLVDLENGASEIGEVADVFAKMAEGYTQFIQHCALSTQQCVQLQFATEVIFKELFVPCATGLPHLRTEAARLRELLNENWKDFVPPACTDMTLIRDNFLRSNRGPEQKALKRWCCFFSLLWSAVTFDMSLLQRATRACLPHLVACLHCIVTHHSM